MEAGFTITKQGWKLLAKLLAGDKLEISKIMVGSGKVPEGVNPGEITELVRPVALATSTVPQVEDKQVSFIVEYRNDLNGGLAEGFWLNEFGVYANDPDNGEILLYYATMGDYPQYVAAYNGQAVDVRRYPVVIALSECYNVELKPPAGAWVTFEELIETLKRRGYHINPNLLINGDFRKPVNRNGKSEYASAGVTIDKWNLEGSGKLELVSDGIVLESTATYLRITQSPKRFTDLIGKLATFSLIYDNILYSVSFHLGDNNGSGHTVIGGVRIYSLGTDLPFAIQISGILRTGVISAVKLELGDQQTLAHKDADGNWVPNDPPDYDLQYLLCSQYSPSTGEFVGSQHSNLNLLDNPDFAIWQRYPTGAYEGVPSNTFIPDRYQFIAASNVSTTLKRIDGGGICCESGSRCQILYKDENAATYAGKTMTLSCLSSKGLQTDTKIMPTNLSAETNLFGLFEHYLTWIYPEETKYRYKLELGSVQTLAHKDENGNWILNDPPPSKALELAKCQRYQRVLSRGTIAQVVNSNSVVIKYPFDQPMRVAPVSVILNPQMKFLSAVEVLPPATNASVLSSDMTDKGVAYIHITGFNWSLPTNTVVALNDDNAVLLDANI